MNDGVIRAGLLAGSDEHGISIARSGVQVLNTGQISKSATGGAGINVGQTTFTRFASDVGIANHGTISAVSGYGITAVNIITNGIEVLNTGTITGGITAVQGGLGADVITNFGTLAGGRPLYWQPYTGSRFWRWPRLFDEQGRYQRVRGTGV